MKSALFAFTVPGGETANKISDGLRKNGFEADVYLHGRDFDSVYEITEKLFLKYDALIFVSACGIAVRAIAPHLKSKAEDPAVIVCDEQGKHVIPLLSGHLGGANRLAMDIADILGGEAVLTTATDIRGVFSVDLWAKENGLHIYDISMIKEVSSRILRGEAVGFYSDYPVSCEPPEGVREGGGFECGIFVGIDSEKSPFPLTMRLMPKNLVLGIGCKRGTSEKAIEEAVKASRVDLKRVFKLCSIDIKADEPGLIEFANPHCLESEFFSADELMSTKGDFKSSDFVRNVTGADNVCERAAALGGGEGKLVLNKYTHDGVAIAVLKKITF